MNVYDFDKTIYMGDSSLDFYLYCVAHYPFILYYLPYQIFAFFIYKVGIMKKTKCKECFFIFLRGIPDIDRVVKEFWNKNEKKIYSWYIKQKQDSDFIISASPEFLLKEICDRIGVTHLIASKVDKHTGKFESENCYGLIKKQRFLEEQPRARVENFYSDSVSDTPMALMAQNAYIVHKDIIKDWEDIL